MKIAIAGKGGSGKSTLSVLLSRSFRNAGYKVLVVDADESNVGLDTLMGMSPKDHLLDYLGGKKGFKEKLNQKMMMDNPAGIFAGKQTIGDIPPNCVAEKDGIKLVIIGKIQDFGEGCACPLGILSKKFLASITESETEVILVDTEAGVEHFGRGMEAECDIVVGVIDPTAESFKLARKIEEMAGKAGKQLYFILNKVEPSIRPIMMRHINPDRVIGYVPKDNPIFLDSLEGRALSRQLSEVDEICRRLMSNFCG